MFLRQMEYLVALNRERHFGRAALACHVSQPALSAAIRTLERELGLPLVRRGHRFEGITPEGQRVLVWARRMVSDARGLDQDVSRLRGGLEGTLRLGAIPTALAASTLVTIPFRERHPRARVEIRSMTSREIARGLATAELDAGFTYLENEPLTDVESTPLWRERYLLLTGTEGPLPAAAEEASWASASALPLCLLTTDMQHRRIVDDAFAAAGVSPQPVLETNSVSTLIAHARTGLPGITAQTWLIAHHLPDDLRALPLVRPAIEHTVGLVTASGAQPSPIVSALLALPAPLELEDHLPLPSGGTQRAAAVSRSGRTPRGPA